jgi:hypothetical protein
MSFFTGNRSSPFCLLTYSLSSGQADTFSQPWISGASPVITAATGEGVHQGFVTITQSNIGEIASLNNGSVAGYNAQFRGNVSSAFAASDDSFIGFGRSAAMQTLSSAGSGFTIDTTRSRSTMMRSV